MLGKCCGNFGGGNFIFEQISTGTLDFLKEDISSKIKNEFPNVDVTKLNILGQPDNNEITVQIFYSVSNTSIEDELNLTFN